MFSGCCGIIAKDNAVTHSFTHIAKLSDVRTSDSPDIVAKKREQKQWEKGSVANSNKTSKSNRSIKKDSIIIDELQWKKLEEKDKYRATVY